jgi:hypothetical protein
MNIRRWIARREPNWQRLDALLRQVEKKGLKSLKASEIRELLAYIARFQLIWLGHARNQVGHILVQNLQQLTSRSYSQIYQGSRRQEWQAVIEFGRWGFPAMVQETFGYTAVATAIFLLGGAHCLVVLLARSDVYVPHCSRSVDCEGTRSPELWMGSILGQRTCGIQQYYD